MKRKLLSILLTLCLAFSLLPTAALAEGEGTLAPAATALPEAVEGVITLESKTYKLSENLAVTATIVVPSGVTATLDLGGKTLKRDSDTVLDIYGELTIKNGRIEKGAGGNAVAIWLNNAAKLTVESDAVVSVSENAEADCYCIAMWKDCTAANLTVKGTLKGGSGLTVNGLIVNTGNTVTIDGATIEAVNFGIYQAGVSETVIKDSNIKGSTAIEVRAGSMTIESGTFTATATEYKCDPNDNGATTEGAALAIAQHTTKKDISVTINGGTFTGIKALNESNPQNNNPTPQVTLNVKNGTFNGDVTITDGDQTSITGGTFSSDVSAYVPNGYIQNENGAVETLGETNAVAKVGENYYKTLAEAINAASDGATITLLKDAETTVELSFTNKTITLDLNGKTVSGTFTDNFSVIEAGADASLTVQDTSVAGTGKIASNRYGISARDGGALIVKSGTIESEYAPLSGNNTTGNMNFTVNGGTLTAKSGPAIYMPGQVSLTITDGVLNGGISLRMGQVNISGGTINAITTGIDMPTDTLNGKPAYAYSGNVWFPDALYVIGGTYTSTDATYGNSLKMNITGGTFNCTNGKGSAVAIYDLGKVAQTANVTISGDAKFATNSAERNAYQVVSFADMNATPITGFGTSELVGKVSTGITGGLFSSDPSDYVDSTTHHVDGSNNSDYPYEVKVGPKAGAAIIVTDNTSAGVAEGVTGLTEADKTAISRKTEVDGVTEAIGDNKATLVGSAANGADKVEVKVEVKVNVTGADMTSENKTLTFKAEPVATITVTKADGTINTEDNVKVSNAMLNGKPITVKLPLPTVDGKLFTPKQIKHTSSDGSVEYFLDTQKTGAKTFEIKDDCAVFKITKFSTFELSGKVTYVAPSYSGGSSSDPTYSVSTPSKTEHGTVTVSPKSASKGDRVTVTVKPDSGYVLETLTVTDKNGNELTLKDKGNGKYTFTMPAGKVEVKATFMEDNSMLNFFYDVPNNAYFYEAVKWAVENGITTGVGNDLFAPEQPCTRAQIVTFLWRAAGSPEPKGAASGMTDVVSGSYYEKAVAWAIENGITTGTTTSTFSPDATCTRAQAVTFLARALKAKAASAAEFSDVPTGSYFADAVAWAAANGVTEGIGGGLFGSDNDCTRGQIVTFLYRAYNK